MWGFILFVEYGIVPYRKVLRFEDMFDGCNAGPIKVKKNVAKAWSAGKAANQFGGLIRG